MLLEGLWCRQGNRGRKRERVNRGEGWEIGVTATRYRVSFGGVMKWSKLVVMAHNSVTILNTENSTI